jgi:phage tail sheath protein FI
MNLVPGVSHEAIVVGPPLRPRSGVPAFIGYAGGPAGRPIEISMWSQMAKTFGSSPGYLAETVRCFFANGGELCQVVAFPRRTHPAQVFREALAALETVETVDLVCAPDIAWHKAAHLDPKSMVDLQRAVIEHCEQRGDRVAVLDSLAPARTVGDRRGVLWQRAQLSSDLAALYWPWVHSGRGDTPVPPCGHVAGSIARTDRLLGVHRAPANVALEAAFALSADAGADDLARLHAASVNPLRALTGRGVRVWGARTLSDDPAWRQLSVRRLVIALDRWARDALAAFVFESNGPRLWRQLRLAIEVRLMELFRAGAFAGATPAESYFVRCDGESTDAATREAGQVVAQVGLAVAIPNEFVVIHIVQDAGGMSAAPA